MMTQPGTITRPPLVSVALISASALGYEILLMRLFSIIQWHHFAYMIISLALLGYGASGTFIALTRQYLLARFNKAYWLNLVLFGLSAVIFYLAAQKVPFNAEEVLWDIRQPLYLLAVYVLLSLPFFFAANGIALALTQYRQAVSRTYAADLLGAGLGSLGIVLLLFLVLPDTSLKYIGALGLVAAFVAARELHMPQRRWQVAALLGAVLLLNLPSDWLEPRISPYKGLNQTLRIPGTQIVKTRSSPLGLITVVASPVIPLRHAPGLSLQAAAPIPKQLGVFTDADALTAINHNPGRQPLDYLDRMTSALPYHLADLKRVLILGAGGGADVQQALNYPVKQVDAVELNPQIVDLVKTDYSRYSGHLYERENVRVHIGEARGFIKRSRQHYDLIQISLLDAFGASSAGLYALNESYTYTVEAIQDYLEHLSRDGYLSISRWIKMPPRDTLKLFATAVHALKGLGINAPENRLVLIRGWQTSTLLLKNSPVTPVEIEKLHVFCQARGFDVAWYPGMARSAANHFNILSKPYFYLAATALMGDQSEIFTNRYKFDIKPATDDRPYFFHFFKWEVLPEVLALRGQGGLPLLESGYLVLVATFLQALILSAALILLPLLVLGHRKTNKPDIRRSRVVGYFFAVGLAFLFVEIAFIQKFILFLHHPLYAVAVVLTAFLVFAGMGSAWTARQHKQQKSGHRKPVKAILCISALGILYAFILGSLLSELMSLPIGIRVLVSILLIAPLAFCMGMPFPLGLARLADKAPAYIPWAWGINGCASVMSAVLATLLAIQFGFTAVIVLAVLLYLFAATMFP